MYTIREARKEDAIAAIKVICESIQKLCAPDHQNDQETINKWLLNKTPEKFTSWLSNSNNYTIVATENNNVLGVGLINVNGEINLCYLKPTAVSKGIGKLIIQELETKAKYWGLSKLSLNSTITAQSFYEHLGFIKSGEPSKGFGISTCHPYEKLIEF